MYQQPNQAKTPNLFTPNYGGAPLGQNPNPALVNNQLQYQRQLAQQQALQRNQAMQIQNAQRAQQMQNMQNAQLLNAQKMQQAQNMQKLPKPQQMQNNIKIQNNQIPNTMNQQVVIGSDGKMYAAVQNQKNVINPIQNIQQQANLNKNQGTILKNNIAQPFQDRKLLAASHNPMVLGHTLEPINQNQKNNHQILQNQQQQNLLYQHHQQVKKEIVNQPINPQPKRETLRQGQQQQNMPLIDNLKNTAFMPIPNAQEAHINQQQKQTQKQTKANSNPTKKSVTLMTVNSLAMMEYDKYPEVESSTKNLHNISGYGANSFNGISKNYNEDKYKKIVDEKRDITINGVTNKVNISYFGVFDGHGGDKCSIFLKDNMHNFLFNSKNFPSNPLQSIYDSFQTAENMFYKEAVKNGKLLDKSGSCAVIALFIDNILYSINLGDSRALYSRSSGQELYQITRDHKPNDTIEKTRVEKSGGKVYYANKTVINGKEVTLTEEQFGKNFTFPYRLLPSGLAVSIIFYNNLGCKNYW